MRNHLDDAYIAKPNSTAAVSFGIITDNIFWNNIVNREDRIYLITSANFREGKTTLAINVALHLSLRRKKILLIDANLRNPKIDKIFRTDGTLGLMQIACDHVPIAKFFYPPGGYIHFIPSGKPDYEPFDVLTSPKLKEAFEEAKRMYDFVIIDCTSVNIYLDPLLICPNVDKTLFVVLADKTEKKEAQIALAKIRNANGKILGVVLNKANLLISSII